MAIARQTVRRVSAFGTLLLVERKLTGQSDAYCPTVGVDFRLANVSSDAEAWRLINF